MFTARRSEAAPNVFVRHEPCPNCGSRNNLARYSDNGAYCFGCEYVEKGDGTVIEQETPVTDWTPITGEVQELKSRGLKLETCERWDYQVGYYDDHKCHIASFREDGRLVGQKIRLPGKEFRTLGGECRKNLPLYGKWLWGPGKYIVITEGELDALSVSQAFDLRWPVVSLPNGVPSTERVLRRDYAWLDQFEQIVLMFDMDDPGREAVEVAAHLLPVGKVKVAELPEKDANETLLRHGAGALVKAFWNARVWRPDGIRSVADLETEFFSPQPDAGVLYPWNGWNEKLGKLRRGELVTITAGSGIGKSTLVRELIHHVALVHREPTGVIMLEENNRRTLEGLVSVELSKNIIIDRTIATGEELHTAFDKLKAAQLYLYDHFGSSEVDNVCARIRYLVQACGVRWVFLDHLSILVSGLEGDERRTIDMAMTKLRTLVSELNCGLVCVVHLRRPQGDKGHEEGAEIHLGQLRGSHAIAQLSDAVVGLQKDPDDPHGPNVESIALKNRWSGDRGSMGMLTYDRMSGRLSDCVF